MKSLIYAVALMLSIVLTSVGVQLLSNHLITVGVLLSVSVIAAFMAECHSDAKERNNGRR